MASLASSHDVITVGNGVGVGVGVGVAVGVGVGTDSSLPQQADPDKNTMTRRNTTAILAFFIVPILPYENKQYLVHNFVIDTS